MSKRTLFLIFALFIITFVLLAITLYNPYSGKISPNQEKTAPTESTAQTVLSFGEPSIATSSSISTLSYSLPINIATGTNKVTAVQLEMQYDPEILTNVVVVPSIFFKNPEILLNQINVKTGRITYAFGIGLTGQGTAGQGTVANLNFSVKAAAAEQTTILFLPKTLVTAEDISQPLKQANNIQIIVGEKP